MMNLDEQFRRQKERIRKRLLEYTRKAFRMLPQMDKPRILDIGCGSGIPTLELAGLCKGEVIGIDIDQPALERLTRAIEKRGLTDRVRAIYCSLFEMDFNSESFDVVWSEGAIYAVGFERGLREWRRFLKPGGFMVVHDEQGNVKEKLEQILKSGYELLGHFLLGEEIWKIEYFAPLEKLISQYLTRGDYPGVLVELRKAQEELDIFKNNPPRCCSVYFVMKKPIHPH